MNQSTRCNPIIGHRIRDARKIKGLSQEALASDLNVSVNYIGQIERGERPVSLNMAKKICNYFHLTLDYLYCGTLPGPHAELLIQETDPRQELQHLINSCSEPELLLCLNILRPLLIWWHANCVSSTSRTKSSTKPIRTVAKR